MDRLEAVTNLRKGSPNDHAHRVIDVAALHFLFDIDLDGLFEREYLIVFTHTLNSLARTADIASVPTSRVDRQTGARCRG